MFGRDRRCTIPLGPARRLVPAVDGHHDAHLGISSADPRRSPSTIEHRGKLRITSSIRRHERALRDQPLSLGTKGLEHGLRQSLTDALATIFVWTFGVSQTARSVPPRVRTEEK